MLEDAEINLLRLKSRDAFHFARAIEAEVRKDDEALIRQMLDALENSSPHTDRSFAWKGEKWQNQRTAAIAAARARLEQPCA